MATIHESVGDLLRDWRGRRRLSQLDLAMEAEISTRHLSFVESGRAAPSRDMLLRLADPLEMPLREQNRLLVAGGFAPIYRERPFDSAEMAAAKAAVEKVIRGHDPFPALAVDRHWNLVLANDAVMAMMTNVAPQLLESPINVLRVSLDPEGLAPRIVNFAEWRHHVLARLRQLADQSGDPILSRLHEELRALPRPTRSARHFELSPVAVPLVLADPQSGAELSFLSTTTVFGTATDVTLAELTLECFYPADEPTRQALLHQVRERP